jgi:hypothetical protein
MLSLGSHTALGCDADVGGATGDWLGGDHGSRVMTTTCCVMGRMPCYERIMFENI